MTANPRLLWLTQHYPPAKGGMALSCDRLVRHLRRLGVHITLYHLRSGGLEKETGYFAEQGCDHSFPMGTNPAHSLNLLWHKLEGEYDAVVAYGYPFSMHAGRVFAAWLGLPLITLLRGNDFDLSILDHRRYQVLQDTLQASALVLTVSADKAKRVKALWPQVRVHNMSNGLDSERWQPLPLDKEQAKAWRSNNLENPSQPVIGLFGHLKEKKGLAFFIETFKRSPLVHSCHLLLIGELDESAAELLQTLPEGSYTLEPFLDRYQLISRYLVCDLIAIPSFYEGTPNVLLEAASLNIPVLGACCGGMADLIFDSLNEHEKHVFDGRLTDSNAANNLRGQTDSGYLFHPTSAESLLDALVRWQTDTASIRAAKSQALYQTVLSQCSAEAEAERYLAAIKTQIAQTANY
ncbi:glycosyltransferase family 4 protein [Shewanella algae]|uniref:glycosyltransferase family 4 protein n=1 Tax=Shewanella algae TaxID=38313 RepID=UPI001AACD83C|nr:glycosyltransferase family 4 protein [Shewanella algae]QTE88919.1 glycosyltransferase family 4 protein [Shewanella algae]